MTEMWSYIDWRDEECESDFKTADAAQSAADIQWAEYVASEYEGLRNGEEYEADIVLVRFRDTDEGRDILERVPSFVLYEHYHGDLAEHGTC